MTVPTQAPALPVVAIIWTRPNGTHDSVEMVSTNPDQFGAALADELGFGSTNLVSADAAASRISALEAECERLRAALWTLNDDAYDYGMPFEHEARVQARIALGRATSQSGGGA
jgi:uncharacterized small protein (DUF1192 family)